MEKTKVALLATALGIWGCGGESQSADRTSQLTAPDHPAMMAKVGRPKGAMSATASDPHAGVLPPGHPPAGAPKAGTPTPGGAPDASKGKWEGDGLAIEVAGLQVKAPEGWVREKPNNPFRMAQFRLPRVEGDSYDGEFTVSVAQGSIEDNVERWRGQFEGTPGAKSRARDANGLSVTIVEIDGTFLYKAAPMAPGPASPRPDYRMLVAIVQAPGGQTFFKGWGPKATMEKWQPGFEQMVNTLTAAR